MTQTPKYNFLIRKDGDNYENRYVNWDTILPRTLGVRYDVQPSAYIQITSLTAPSALIEVGINFSSGNLTLDTNPVCKCQSLGFAKLINTTGTNYTYVLETTDGNHISIGKPSNIIDLDFRYFLDNTVVDPDTITSYMVCLEFE
jgi:hypothetical protein